MLTKNLSLKKMRTVDSIVLLKEYLCCFHMSNRQFLYLTKQHVHVLTCKMPVLVSVANRRVLSVGKVPWKEKNC